MRTNRAHGTMGGRVCICIVITVRVKNVFGIVSSRLFEGCSQGNMHNKLHCRLFNTFFPNWSGVNLIYFKCKQTVPITDNTKYFTFFDYRPLPVSICKARHFERQKKHTNIFCFFFSYKSRTRTLCKEKTKIAWRMRMFEQQFSRFFVCSTSNVFDLNS